MDSDIACCNFFPQFHLIASWRIVI